ncbi:MAG: hypothetical protein JKY27_09465 [Magnetovibrio sp.]|nr:hypothetical protein [Magnetovibrio sp.]
MAVVRYVDSRRISWFFAAGSKSGLYGLVFCPNRFFKSDRIRRTTGTEPVLAEVHGHQFLIPKNIFQSPYRGEDSKVLLLWYLWPEVEGYSRKRHDLFWRAVGSDVRTESILTYQAGRSVQGEGDLDQVFFDFWLPHVVRFSATPQPYKYGLTHVGKGFAQAKDVYVSDDQNEIITCSVEGRVPSPQCEIQVVYSRKMYLTIGFPKHMLSDWRQIQNTTLNLFQEWETTAEQAKDQDH